MASKTEGLVILSREVEDLKEELVQVKNHSLIQYPCRRWLSEGTCQKRFSGIRPLRGYPPPTPLTENRCEKKKVFFLSGKGGYPPPLNGKSAKLLREFFS